jgi:hypothetical protein
MSDVFAAASSWDGAKISVRFSGNADLGAKDALEVLLPRVHTDATMLWQRRSLHALKCFANELIQIES